MFLGHRQSGPQGHAVPHGAAWLVQSSIFCVKPTLCERFISLSPNAEPQSEHEVPCIQRRGGCTAGFSEETHNFGYVMPSPKGNVTYVTQG